jgi:hypothetical protein
MKHHGDTLASLPDRPDGRRQHPRPQRPCDWRRVGVLSNHDDRTILLSRTYMHRNAIIVVYAIGARLLPFCSTSG